MCRSRYRDAGCEDENVMVLSRGSRIRFGALIASMVVFEEGQPRKAEYRQFNIKTVEGIDDYASIREVITTIAALAM